MCTSHHKEFSNRTRIGGAGRVQRKKVRLGMFEKTPKVGNLVLKQPVFNNTVKMKIFKLCDKWKKVILPCSPLSSMDPHWFWAISDQPELIYTILKKIRFVKFAHLEHFSIVTIRTFFLWTHADPPILVGSSKSHLRSHLQTYWVPTNTLDGCSVHPSWRSCAFKIGGTFFLGRRK